MNQEFYTKFSEKYPYLSICRYGNDDFVGIVQNSDNNITVLYDFGILPTQNMKTKFLQLGETWWWESNRTIPINIFLRHEWVVFKDYKRIFNNKNLEILVGPCICLNKIANTKQKRKFITLVKRVL